LPDVLARVNGDAITKADFERALSQSSSAPAAAARRSPRRDLPRLLDQLVGLSLLKQEVAARKVQVPDADVDARIAEIKKQFPSETSSRRCSRRRRCRSTKCRADQRDDLAITSMLPRRRRTRCRHAEQIDEFYKNNPTASSSPSACGQHILISVPQSADAAAKAPAARRPTAVSSR
jgi:hypothetical protein